MARELLRSGASVLHRVANTERTPVLAAAGAAVDLLTDQQQGDVAGATPLELAALLGMAESCRLLIAYGAAEPSQQCRATVARRAGMYDVGAAVLYCRSSTALALP